MQASQHGFEASWRVPFVARGIQRVADLASFNWAIPLRAIWRQLVADDDILTASCARCATRSCHCIASWRRLFSKQSGRRKAHQTQYILVGLAQACSIAAAFRHRIDGL